MVLLMNENLYLNCKMNKLKLKVTAGINSCAVNKALQLLYNIQYDYERVNREYELWLHLQTTFMTLTEFIGVNKKIIKIVFKRIKRGIVCNLSW